MCLLNLISTIKILIQNYCPTRIVVQQKAVVDINYKDSLTNNKSVKISYAAVQIKKVKINLIGKHAILFGKKLHMFYISKPMSQYKI